MTDSNDDLKLIREIVAHGGRKYTAGNIDRSRYQRLVDLGWLTRSLPTRATSNTSSRIEAKKRRS